MKKQLCDDVDCTWPAYWVVIGDMDDDKTHACTQHVGVLLGSSFEGPTNTRWTIERVKEVAK